MSDYTPREGDLVDITIRGARVLGQDVSDEMSVLVGGRGDEYDVPLDDPAVIITPVVPAEWPPQSGDLWRDGDGDLWWAVPSTPHVELINPGGTLYTADAVRKQWAPVRLEYRAPQDGGAPDAG